MTKPSYETPADYQMADVRLRALSIAHNESDPPAQVVARAKACIEFVEGFGDGDVAI